MGTLATYGPDVSTETI